MPLTNQDSVCAVPVDIPVLSVRGGSIDGSLESASVSYTIDASKSIAFSVNVTNLDITGRDMTLSYQSSFWVIGPPQD
jgi:hypothetical protein